MSELRDFIRQRTHGDPPVRSSLPSGHEKWTGYLLGVEEAICAVEELERWLPRAVREELEGALHAALDDRRNQ